MDDEPHVLGSLKLQLRRHFDVETVESGGEGLRVLKSEEFAVVVSDMRMPEMNGAKFLSEVYEHHPNVQRILLTGFSEVDAAIEAINEGRILRFLTKPCPPEILRAAVHEAVELHEAKRAEARILDETVGGFMKGLSALLGLLNPQAFGRVERLLRRVRGTAENLGMESSLWVVEAATVLKHLGFVLLPDDATQALLSGAAPEGKYAERVQQAHGLPAQLFGDTPRLDRALALLDADARTSQDDTVRKAAEMLMMVLRFDELERSGTSPHDALKRLEHEAFGDPEMRDALKGLLQTQQEGRVQKRLPLSAIEAGMMFGEDVLTAQGALLVSEGQHVTEAALQHLAHFDRKEKDAPILVWVDDAAD